MPSSHQPCGESAIIENPSAEVYMPVPTSSAIAQVASPPHFHGGVTYLVFLTTHQSVDGLYPKRFHPLTSELLAEQQGLELPPGLVVMAVAFNDFDRRTHCGPYKELILAIPGTVPGAGGQAPVFGAYLPFLYLNSDFPTCIGREWGGYAKRMAVFRVSDKAGDGSSAPWKGRGWERTWEVIRGYDRLPYQDLCANPELGNVVARASVRNLQPGVDDIAKGPMICLKVLPGPDLHAWTPALKQLVAVESDLDEKADFYVAGPDDFDLAFFDGKEDPDFSFPLNDPLGRIEVAAKLVAYQYSWHLTLDRIRVLHDYLD